MPNANTQPKKKKTSQHFFTIYGIFSILPKYPIIGKRERGRQGQQKFGIMMNE
jgi:hypothetical protein